MRIISLLLGTTVAVAGCTSPPVGHVPSADSVPAAEPSTPVELVVEQHWRPNPRFIEGAIAFFEVRTAAGAVVDRQVTYNYAEVSTTRIVYPGTLVVLSDFQLCPADCPPLTWGSKVLDERTALCHGTVDVPATARFTVVFDIDGVGSAVRCRVSTLR